MKPSEWIHKKAIEFSEEKGYALSNHEKAIVAYLDMRAKEEASKFKAKHFPDTI